MKFLLKLIWNTIKVCTTIMVLAVFMAVYSTYIEPKLLITSNHNIDINRNGDSNIKVVQFTDTHLGGFFSLEDLEKVVNKINKEKADIVVFTGDLMDNASEYEDIDEISSVLSKIESKYGKYAIYGNRDYGGGAVRYYNKIMKDSGFKLLVNESIELKINNIDLNIFGGDDALMGNFSAERTAMNMQNNQVNLLLIHEPDLADNFQNYPVDLILSGHSHGGQVYIPFYGPLKQTSLAEKYTRGFYDIDNERETKLYVNSGIGNTKLPFRFFNIPKVTVFNLKI